jgi:hypothetical protein
MSACRIVIYTGFSFFIDILECNSFQVCTYFGLQLQKYLLALLPGSAFLSHELCPVFYTPNVRYIASAPYAQPENLLSHYLLDIAGYSHAARETRRLDPHEIDKTRRNMFYRKIFRCLRRWLQLRPYARIYQTHQSKLAKIYRADSRFGLTIWSELVSLYARQIPLDGLEYFVMSGLIWLQHLCPKIRVLFI